MPAKLALYFTATQHRLFRWSGGALAHEADFTADDRGLARFGEYMKRRRGALVSVIADLAGEDFHEDQIPYLRGADRRAVIQRRLAQRYRDTRLAAALFLGHVAEERRNERLLLASFTNVQQFSPWLDALSEAGVMLAGVYSTALLAPSLVAALGISGNRCLIVSANRAGMRQCFLENGRLRFARLERIAETDPAAVAAFVHAETVRLTQYLATLRALPREGPPVQAYVIAPDGQEPVFQRALAADARVSFRVLRMADAARLVGLKAVPAGASAEQLYLRLALRQPPKEQFAPDRELHSFAQWRLRRAILAAGALGFAACTAYAGMQWFAVLDLREGLGELRRETLDARQQYQRITAAFPVTNTTTENLRAAVLEFRNLAARTASPEGALLHVSRALDRFPQLELDSLTWSAGSPAGAGETKPAAASAPVKPPASGADRTQTIELSGRVNAALSSDYRTVTGQVQRFAAALAADPAWQVVRTQLPFDITPEGTLSGGIGETVGAGEAPRFAITIARQP